MLGFLTAASRQLFSIEPLGQSARGMATKLKSHSGAKKRFFPTGNGNFKRWRVGIRHLNSGFSSERVNRLSRSAHVNNTQKKMLHRVLPYK
ncbi:ribosomal protein L35 [Syncephalastrum racemosum]|uniref:50S ribosomal protein L35 n=1 Tax=Syncephalastrum racemosum TaxID=13706 RepID=A0A1X2HHE9_SYNRA|nr:ribosomal protein L35 [Syncephalastrum racemosum]